MFNQNYPQIELTIHPITTRTRWEMVYSADLLLTPCDFGLHPRPDVESTLLTTQQPLVALPPQHSLGSRQEIQLEDLKGENLIVPFANEIFGPYARNAMAAYRKCHSQIRRIEAEDAQTGLLMVEFGKGLMLIPHHLKHRVYPHTRTVLITDPDCIFPIYAYWNRSEDNPAADLLYETLYKDFHGKKS